MEIRLNSATYVRASIDPSNLERNQALLNRSMKHRFYPHPSPLPKGEGTGILAPFSPGRRVGDEGISYLHSATPEISQLVIQYSLLECDQCAIALMQWLNSQNIPGKILKLKTKRRSELYIVSDRITANQAITENGTHYGVEVLGKVFDHLSPEGLSRENWLNDFHCRGGQFLLEELDSLQQPKPD